MDATKQTPLIQWVVLIFMIAITAFTVVMATRSKEGFGTYSPVIMGEFALIGMIVRSIFKNTEDDQ